MARMIAAEVEDDVAERIDAIAHVDDTDSRQVADAALRLYALLPKEARASLRYVEASGDPQLIRTAARRIARVLIDVHFDSARRRVLDSIDSSRLPHFGSEEEILEFATRLVQRHTPKRGGHDP